MTEKQYEDFDLLLEPHETGYRARVLMSPVGQATTNFDMPLSNVEVENVILRLGQSRRRVRRIESTELETAKLFGKRLFDALFNGEVGACYRSSLNEVNGKENGLRLRLRLSEAPELVDVPWEFLYDATVNRFLNLSVDTPLVRYLDLPGAIKPLLVKPPLRVLVMISSPTDYVQLDTEQEWQRLKAAMSDLEQQGLLVIERVEMATLDALQSILRKTEFHIFHFIGHGAFDAQASDGVLLLEDEQGRAKQVSGQTLGMLLHDEKSLRLALLNACEGGRTSKSDPFAGVGQNLLQQGIPAVIAMQFEVTDETAITLAHHFYAALADGYPVDAALAEARKAIFARNDIEWGTPVLYMRSPDGRIFNVAKLGERERKKQQMTLLWNKVQTAMASSKWNEAEKLLLQILTIDANHPAAMSTLPTIQQRLAPQPVNSQAINAQAINPQPTNPVSPSPELSAAPLHLPSSTTNRRRAGGWLTVAAVVVMALIALVLWRPWATDADPLPTPQLAAQLDPTPTKTGDADTQPPVQAVEPGVVSRFEGTWYTNFAEIHLQQSGNQVTGKYQWYGDNRWWDIQGTVADNVLSGHYMSNSSTEFVFAMNDEGSYFEGHWLAQSSGRKIQWCGTKSGPLPEDCGFSGKWLARSDYCADRQATAHLVQEGRIVRGTFENGKANGTGTINGVIGGFGSETHYSTQGSFRMDADGFQSDFRWNLVDLENRQFTGWWSNSQGQHPWCGWREGESAPSCGVPPSC